MLLANTLRALELCSLLWLIDCWANGQSLLCVPEQEHGRDERLR